MDGNRDSASVFCHDHSSLNRPGFPRSALSPVFGGLIDVRSQTMTPLSIVFTALVVCVSPAASAPTSTRTLSRAVDEQA